MLCLSIERLISLQKTPQFLWWTSYREGEIPIRGLLQENSLMWESCEIEKVWIRGAITGLFQSMFHLFLGLTRKGILFHVDESISLHHLLQDNHHSQKPVKAFSCKFKSRDPRPLNLMHDTIGRKCLSWGLKREDKSTTQVMRSKVKCIPRRSQACPVSKV